MVTRLSHARSILIAAAAARSLLRKALNAATRSPHSAPHGPRAAAT